MSDMIHEKMDYDVVIVGAGVGGLSAAIRLKQLKPDCRIVILEKGSEIGAHILSGAVIDITPLKTLLPEIAISDFPFDSAVTEDHFYFLTAKKAIQIPHFLMPKFMHNHGNYITSLGKLCQFLANIAENMGIEIYTGMAASELVYDNDQVVGVVAGVFGIGANGLHKPDFQPGMALHGKYILIAEGARGSLSKQVIERFQLDRDSSPQKYGIGFKEIWEVPSENFTQGKVYHTLGTPLSNKAGGGGFLYMARDNLVSVGMVVHLDYRNPTLSPYDEFQQMKHHSFFSTILSGGRRISYGARVINEGGLQSIPRLSFPGGMLIGCSAGFVNLPRIKGTHNAIVSAVLAAESVAEELSACSGQSMLTSYPEKVKNSSIYQELTIVRNVKPLWSKFGLFGGLILGGLDMWTNYLLNFSIFGTLKHTKPDSDTLDCIDQVTPLNYPKPDGVLSFDKLTNVSFTATYHSEDQLCHLKLGDYDIPVTQNLPIYGEPARLYCPAGVYEIIYDQDGNNPRFTVNAQNCIHCKTCDIKDPAHNITWHPPQGGEGPNYSGM